MASSLQKCARVIQPLAKGLAMNQDQWTDGLYRALETESGGIQVFEDALRSSVDPKLKEKLVESLERSRNHEQILHEVFGKLGLDPAARAKAVR
jgi:rubrerythrin